MPGNIGFPSVEVGEEDGVGVGREPPGERLVGFKVDDFEDIVVGD
jgi:hypothetical protein